MKERNEDNELLNILLGIKRKAKLKAVAETILAAIIGMLLILFWTDIMPCWAILICSILWLAVCIAYFLQIEKSYQNKGKRKLYIAFVEQCLSIQEYTEVKPIDANACKDEMLNLADLYIKLLPVPDTEEYKKTISNLLETAKFYARISTTKNNSVEIFVKYDNEEKLRYYKAIDKVSFLDEYSIQEENEQEEN